MSFLPPFQFIYFLLAIMQYVSVLLSVCFLKYIYPMHLLLCSVGHQPSLIHRSRHFGLAHL